MAGFPYAPDGARRGGAQGDPLFDGMGRAGPDLEARDFEGAVGRGVGLEGVAAGREVWEFEGPVGGDGLAEGAREEEDFGGRVVGVVRDAAAEAGMAGRRFSCDGGRAFFAVAAGDFADSEVERSQVEGLFEVDGAFAANDEPGLLDAEVVDAGREVGGGEAAVVVGADGFVLAVFDFGVGYGGTGDIDDEAGEDGGEERGHRQTMFGGPGFWRKTVRVTLVSERAMAPSIVVSVLGVISRVSISKFAYVGTAIFRE